MKALLPFHLNKVGAGFPSPATDYVEDDIDLNSHLIKNIPSTFLIRVQGKSMDNVGIYNGDLLVVDRSLDPKNFSIVIANVNEELVVKSFLRQNNQNFLTSGSKKSKDKINLINIGPRDKGVKVKKIANIIAKKAQAIIIFLLSKLSEIEPIGHWKNAPAKVIRTNKIEVSNIDKFITVAYTADMVKMTDILKPTQNMATLPKGDVL